MVGGYCYSSDGTTFNYYFSDRRGTFFDSFPTKKINPTKKLVIYAKNKPKIIEVTVNEETETKYSKQVQVTTKNGKTMWVNKRELF
jgi:uncharacterized protein with ATP-grasp and redox domains